MPEQTDIKHHRVPAPDICWDRPNLPALLDAIEAHLAEQSEEARAGTDYWGQVHQSRIMEQRHAALHS
jgi:hypothetical protein